MDDNSENISVASGCSFQIQLMRCGFLPQNSVSSFDLDGLSDLEINQVDGGDDTLSAPHQQDDQSQKSRDSTQSTLSRSGGRRNASPMPPRRGGLRATLSFRLNRPRMLKDGPSSGGDGLGTSSLLHRHLSNGSAVVNNTSRTRRVTRTYSDQVLSSMNGSR
jgi:hypothetical protein